MNSRPLCKPASGELDILTPAHFLVGHPLTIVPEADLEEINPARLSRWQLVQQMMQGFWSRWHKEYLATLHQRSKWKSKTPDLKIGDLVLIREDNLPPTKWCRGLITEIHPGRDNLIRVVSVKTATGTLKRPIAKICPLPIN